MKAHRDKQRRPKRDIRQIGSVATPQQLAFRSGAWTSYLMGLISAKTGHIAQEVRGDVIKMALNLEWWQPKCPQCGALYRYAKNGLIHFSVDKTDKTQPTCAHCDHIWTWAGLYMKPGDMNLEFEWEYEIVGNAPKLGELIQTTYNECNQYFIHMYASAAETKRKSS